MPSLIGAICVDVTHVIIAVINVMMAICEDRLRGVRLE